VNTERLRSRHHPDGSIVSLVVMPAIGAETVVGQAVSVTMPDHRMFMGLARHAATGLRLTWGAGVCMTLKRRLIGVTNSTEHSESIEAGLTHLIQPGPAISGLGRHLIGDEDLS
jgi:hypothetical protein